MVSLPSLLAPMKSLLPLLFALAVSTVSLHAESPTSLALNVRVEVQMVTMPLEKGLPLLPNLRHAGSIDGAFSQIQKMIEEGAATLLGWPEVVTKSGQRAVTEDIHEIRYATEFGKPHPVKAPAADKKDGPAESVPVHRGAPVPSAFETRNAGSTLEVEPVLGSDGKTIDLNLVPQHVRLLDFAVAASGRDSNGHDWKIEQPRFYTAKTTTSVTVAAGQRVLLAEFRGLEGSDEISFFILKADVLPVAGTRPE
jgi:hypothetical protein